MLLTMHLCLGWAGDKLLEKKKHHELLEPYEQRTAAAVSYLKSVRPGLTVQTGALLDPKVHHSCKHATCIPHRQHIKFTCAISNSGSTCKKEVRARWILQWTCNGGPASELSPRMMRGFCFLVN